MTKRLPESVFPARCKPFGISNGRSQITNLRSEICNSEQSEDISAFRDPPRLAVMIVALDCLTSGTF